MLLNGVSGGECTNIQAGHDCTAPMPLGAANGLPANDPTMEDLAEWINNNAPND